MTIPKIAQALFAAVLEFVSALQGKVDSDELKIRALKFIEDNRRALADAEALERKIFSNSDGASD